MGASNPIDRRAVLVGIAAAGACAVAGPLRAAPAPLARPIPSTGETVPAVGLGSWITFNVGDDPELRSDCAEVMRAFFAGGGRLIDSSPMYGSAESVIGEGWARLGKPQAMFSATKVWIGDGAAGPAQMEESRRLWGVDRFDLIQVHNLLAWEEHLATLAAMKAEGRVRLVGITTSHGLRHDVMEQVMRAHPLDTVQLTLNVVDREAEERLLPLAADRSMAVIVNRPFRQGALTRALDGVDLPGWSAELGVTTWAQALLKFVLAHPAVTCVIPATSRPEHAAENLLAAAEPLPDARLRERIAADAAAAL